MSAIVVWAGVLGSIFGVVTSIAGLIAIYRGSIRKGYAAERDFNHLKEDFKSLSANLNFLLKEQDTSIKGLAKDLDTRCDRIDQNLLEIKALQLSELGQRIAPKKND